MIKIKNKKECCGCTSCMSVCPRHCIEMKDDEEGFKYPVVDTAECVNCHLCEMYCPIQNVKKPDSSVTTAYAARVKDAEIRMSSSSGGIFSAIALFILNQNGVVYGAAFDDDYNVVHCRIDSKNDLYRLRGSKYVQSDMGHSYENVLSDLKNGTFVLFTGTACQIAGLKSFLGREYGNLYTIDVLCHGVPSPKVWRAYKEGLSARNDVFSINFRDKSSGWKRYSFRCTYKNEEESVHHYDQDLYMKMFLSNLILRPSCHDCRFKEMPRLSDITLGDAWGIEKHSPEMDDNTGTSVVLIHSENGQALVKKIEENVELKSANLDIILPTAADSRKSVKPNRYREKFFKEFNSGKNLKELEYMTKHKISTRIKNKIKNIIFYH